MTRCAAILPLLVASSLAAQTNPRYTLSLDGPCGETVIGPPGSTYDDGTGGGPFFQDRNGDGRTDEAPADRPGQTWNVVLRTSENPDEHVGAFVWSVALGVGEPFRITDITTGGTASCVFGFPECRRTTSFLVMELTGPPDGAGPQTEDNAGAIIFVVLKFDAAVSLPPEGNEAIAKIRVFAEFPPAEGDVVTGRVFFGSRIGSGGEPMLSRIRGPGGAVTLEEGDPPITVEDCVVHLKASSVAAFMRCDVNEDGRLDISDAIWTFNELFRGGARTRCLPAADCNGDGERDITDPIYALTHLFSGGPSPPPPFPDCGRLDVPIEECPPGSTFCP